MKMQIAIKPTRKESSDASASLGQEVKLKSLLFFKWSYPFDIFPSLCPPWTFAHIQEKKDNIQQN